MTYQVIWEKADGELIGELPILTQGGTLETLTFLALYRDGSNVNLTGKTITATITARDGSTYALEGAFTGANGSFTYAPAAVDVGTGGSFSAIFSYTDGSKWWHSDPVAFTVLPNPSVTATLPDALTGVSEAAAAWVSAGAAGGALGTAAYADTGDFDAAGSAAAVQAAAVAAAAATGAQVANNLSDLADMDTARSNLKAQPLELRHTIVLLGDSITESNDEEGRDVGYFVWANAMLQSRFVVSNYAGVGGNTTAQMYARLQSDVIDYDPQFCLVMGGANDVVQDVSSATTISNLQSIYEDLYAAGIRVIACTINPSTSITTSARRDAWYAVRDWQISYARSNQIILIDTAAAYTDASSGWPYPVTDTTYDGVHPTALGAGRMGKAIADALREYVIPMPQLPLENDGDYMITPNPLLIGTGGAVSGTASGDVAAHWQASAGVHSKVARTDYQPGEWQQMTPDGSGQALLYHNTFPLMFGFDVGDEVCAVVEIETDDDWVGASALRAQITFRTSGGSSIDFVGALASSPNSGTAIINPGSVILRTDPFPVPATTGQIELLVTFAATSGTVRIGRVGIVNPDLTFNKITSPGTNALRMKLMSGVTLNSGYASFDGSYFSIGDLWSYALASNFDGDSATMICRARLNTADLATATARYFCVLQNGSQNYLRMYKSAANTVTVRFDTGNQSPVTITHTPTGGQWYTYGLTTNVVANQTIAYVDGSQQGSTGACTAFTNPILKGYCAVGGIGYLPANNFIGDVSDVIVGLSGAATPSAANMATIHAALAAGTLTTGTLDTIFGSGKWCWWSLTN